MSAIDLPQDEADRLLLVEKHAADNRTWNFPVPGDLISIPLRSPEVKDEFDLDIERGSISLTKKKYQNRARKCYILCRLDIASSFHRNPDGLKLPETHLHIYREGFGDKYAIDPPRDIFSDFSDNLKIYDSFCRFCNITIPPSIAGGAI